jgi:hypothetical protein
VWIGLSEQRCFSGLVRSAGLIVLVLGTVSYAVEDFVPHMSCTGDSGRRRAAGGRERDGTA